MIKDYEVKPMMHQPDDQAGAPDENCTHDCSTCGADCASREGGIQKAKLNEHSSVKKVIGVVSGIVLSKVVSNVMETPTAVSIPACIVSVAFSMAIGIIFGLLPALKASKLNPIDALRSE